MNSSKLGHLPILDRWMNFSYMKRKLSVVYSSFMWNLSRVREWCLKCRQWIIQLSFNNKVQVSSNFYCWLCCLIKCEAAFSWLPMKNWKGPVWTWWTINKIYKLWVWWLLMYSQCECKVKQFIFGKIKQ